MKNQRVIILFILVAAGFLLVLLRAAYLQVFPDQRLADLKSRQYETTITLHSRRGAIFDRNGRELAVSVRADSLFADPTEIAQPRVVARQLAKILKMDASELYKKISDKNRQFIWIKRQLATDLISKVKDLKIRGLGFVEESERVYPNGKLAAATLGFVGREGQGLAGLEARYEQSLAGQKKKISLPRDARGRPLLISGHVLSENSDGSDLELTIDHELQFMLERELQLAQQKFLAKGAWGIITDPNTGEVLAMGQSSNDSEALYKNKLITDVYEPASVLKPILVAQALDTKKISINSRFDCEQGKMVIGGRTIREAEAKEKWGHLSISEILAFSSNIGSVKIAQELGPVALREGLLNFGFGQKTKIDLQGESRGILHELPWRPHHFANISFGHGISVTALQIAASYGAIANGGHLLRPYFVKSIKDPSTGRTQYTQTQALRRVISQDTSDKMKLLLTNSTAHGSTGFRARISGYPVAGKTGTAQKVDESGAGYKKGSYISSFVGFVPAQDPRFVIYIAVDEPQKEYYGSAVAAPVFARVATIALRRAQIPPVLITEQNIIPEQVKKPQIQARRSEDRDFGAGTMPDLSGLTVREALKILRSSQVDVRLVGEGSVVLRSWPEPSQGLPKQKPVALFLSDF